MTTASTDLVEALFAGPGEIRARCRAIDWGATALGPVATWPASLRLAVRMCLDARFPMTVWAGPELVLVYNDGYPPVLGAGRHPWALGRPAREVWADIWDRLGPELARVMCGESTVHEDERFLLDRGGPVKAECFFTYSFTPIQEDDGRVVGALNVFLETTEQVRALNARTAWLRTISDSSHDAIFAKDLRGRMLFANAATLALVGKPAEAVMGKTDLEFLADADTARQIMENDRRIMEDGTTTELEERVPLPDGTPRVWHSVKTPYRDASGRVAGLLGISRDITERKESARRLEQERARLQAILDTIPVGLFIFEADGRASLVNDEARRIWAGAAPLERIDDFAEYRGFWPGSGARLSPEEWPAAEALLGGRKSKDVVVDIERFDGTRGTIVVSGAPIRDPGGGILGAVTAIQDISELRRAHEHLEDADRRKNEFLAVLSHELRNPLAPVKNSLFILDRVPPDSDKARRARDVIGRQIEQLAHLVDDLLDVTRITRGKVQLKRAPLELNELVRRTVEDHRGAFEQAGLELRLEPAPAPLPVEGDSNRVAQIVGNLLHNSAKFTPRGGRVTVALAAEGDQAAFRVADTGAGMTPEVLARLFEPFMQADTSLDRSKGGLGLGLALVKGLAELHGGSVEVRSDGPGRGAEFTVRLPLDRAERGEGPRGAVAPAAVRRRVLVVEDLPDTAESLRTMLELAGHDVAVAHDGPAALARARAFRPEVVLCDIGLPGMSGYDVARAFRADETLRGARLIALSGYALPEDLRRAAEAGFERHLAKPASPDALDVLLREAPVRAPAARP